MKKLILLTLILFLVGCKTTQTKIAEPPKVPDRQPPAEALLECDRPELLKRGLPKDLLDKIFEYEYFLDLCENKRQALENHIEIGAKQ